MYSIFHWIRICYNDSYSSGLISLAREYRVRDTMKQYKHRQHTHVYGHIQIYISNIYRMDNNKNRLTVKYAIDNIYTITGQWIANKKAQECPYEQLFL